MVLLEKRSECTSPLSHEIISGIEDPLDQNWFGFGHLDLHSFVRQSSNSTYVSL